MNRTIAMRLLLCMVILAAGFGLRASAQPDREVRNKQGELKKEYNDVQEKNQIVRQAAKDKPLPTSGRRRGNINTGYDFTQVRGYGIRPQVLQDRLDLIFKRAAELGLGAFEEEYHLNGQTVPCKNGQGSASISRVEVYVVEATPEEIERDGINPYDLLEVRMIKQESCPEAKREEDEEDDEEGRRRRATTQQQPPKQYILSGMDLWSAIKSADEGIYDDLLARRINEEPIPQPDFRAEKRGPFIVMTQTDLETATSRFSDFWNVRDTMRLEQKPGTEAANGPLFTGQMPLMFPEESKIRLQNPNKDPLLITKATFTGANASNFKVKSPMPMQLDAKGSPQARQDIQFEYDGSSQYETFGQLRIESQNASMMQIVDVVANPGKQPSDFVVLDASLDKIELRSPARSGFAADWRLGYSFGTPQISLPRWTSGMSTLSVGYKHQMSMGIVFPMNMNTDGVPGPLGYSSGYLQSAMGYNVSFDFNFGFPFSLGGFLTVTDRFDATPAYHDMKLLNLVNEDRTYENNFFNISTAALLYYPIMFRDRMDASGILVRLDLGGGFMRVDRNYSALANGKVLWPDNTMRDVKKGELSWMEREKDIFDVYIRVDFINTGAKNNYGIGMQYFSGRMMADLWLELTEWLRVEAKYSFLLRTREVWEYDTSVFLVTPRIRLGLPSLFN